MVTLVGTQSNLLDAMKALLELEYDSVELYTAVINRLQNEKYKTQISEFKKDHEEHIEQITQLLEKHHVPFTKGPDGAQVFAVGKVMLKKLIGTDLDILKVMIPAEEDNISAYNRMLQYDDLDSTYISVFQKGLEDEIKHKDWLLNIIGD